jgi:uncharacterized protein (TIGR02996 family)
LEIEAAITAAPDDPSAYLVYADWLQSRGDPRGELIALQHAMRANNDVEEFARFRKHEEVLRTEHAAEWLGPTLASLPRRARFDWRLGFVETARLDAASPEVALRPDGEIANPYTLVPSNEPPLVDLVTALLDSVSGWTVRTLTVSGPIDDVILALGLLPSRLLRRLVINARRVHEDAKRILAPEIMRMLNANVDVDLGAEKFRWVRPKPSKRRT